MGRIVDLIFLAVVIVAFMHMIKERRRVPEGQIVQESLVGNQKTLIWILCLLAPVLSGAVFYYGWRKKLPSKAKQANQISLWAFLIDIVVGVALSMLFMFVAWT